MTSITRPSNFPEAGQDVLDKYGYQGGASESDTLAVVDPSGLVDLRARAQRTIDNAVPPHTRRAYEGDLRRFAAWCSRVGLIAMPASPATIINYMRHLADCGRKVATIERAVAAIATSHVRSGFPSPWSHSTVEDMRKALRRELGVRSKKKLAIDDAVLRKLLEALPDSRIGLRDRALLTMGWAGAFRRSELVALDVDDVTPAAKGLVVLVRRSKTDQERRGDEVPIFFSNRAEHCPVRSLDAWLAAADVKDGAIFRALGRRDRLGGRLSPSAVADRVQAWAKVSGLAGHDYGAHSLRSGFITTAARGRKDIDAIMVTSRHRSVASVREYIQRETIFERAAGEGLL
jgi:integrase